jgi:hypothetical protein
MTSNQLPLPHQIRKYRVVGEIRCSNRFGDYTTTVYAAPGETVGEAMEKRIAELLDLKNLIITTRRFE